MPKAKCSNLFYSLLKAVALDFGGYTLKSPGKRKKKKKTTCVQDILIQLEFS